MTVEEFYGVSTEYVEQEIKKSIEGLTEVVPGTWVTKAALLGPKGDLNPDEILRNLKYELRK